MPPCQPSPPLQRAYLRKNTPAKLRLSLLTFYCNVGSWLYLVKPEGWKAVVLDSRSDSSGELVQMNEMFGHVRGQHRVDQTLPHLLVRLHVQILKNRRDTYMVW